MLMMGKNDAAFRKKRKLQSRRPEEHNEYVFVFIDTFHRFPFHSSLTDERNKKMQDQICHF